MPNPTRLADRRRPGPVRPVARSAVMSVRLLPAMAITLLLSLLATSGSAAQDALPPGFADEAVLNLTLPTAFTFTPDDRMLIATKPGRLLVRSGTGAPTVALDISAKVCGNYERGLLGVAVDPDFATTGYVFLYYTFDKFGTCARDTARVPVNRVSRFVMRGNTINPGTEKILIDNVVSRHGNHNAGDLEFGRDGFLYVSIGDSGCDLSLGDRCGPDNRNARHPEYLLGKIARITRDGGIPRTNPYLDPATSARCALTGRTTVGKRCQETFASGLRNPFRFAFDPNASGTRFLINDVGQFTWEEIDEGRKGVDYGWNVREGFCATSTTNCNPTAPSVNGYTSPIHDYPHVSNCSSITGGAFVPDGVWPAEYDGSYLFADYVCGGIYRLVADGSGGFRTPGPNDNAVGVPFVRPNDGSPVHLRFGPHGATQALYYTTFADGGQIRRIAYTADANRAPAARVDAAPSQGDTPLAVQFDGRGSSDPENDALSYAWDFGDGTPAEPNGGAQISHTYGDAGQFTATLTVADPAGRTDRATVAIDAGNQLPRAVIDTPVAADRFVVGREIRLSGHAEDASGNPLPDATLNWEVLLHHNTHAHPFFERSGESVAFDAPFPEDLDAAKNSYLEIRLTASTAGGTSRRVSRDLQPTKVDLTFASSPPGLTVRVNDVVVADGETVTSWAGWHLRLDAPRQRAPSGQRYAWAAWSDGAKTASRLLTTPGATTNVRASFQPVTVVSAAADAHVLQVRPTATSGRGPTLSVAGGRNGRSESFLRFNVPALPGPVRSATLRLWVPNIRGAGTVNGPAVMRAGTRWAERTISWEKRPPKLGAVVDDADRIAPGSWVEFDVTRLIGGGGSFGFALVSPSPDAVTFSSRQGAQPPELVIVTADRQTAAGPSPSVRPALVGGDPIGPGRVPGVRRGLRGQEP